MHKYTLKLYKYAVLGRLPFSEGREDDGEKICRVGVEKIWNCILMFVTLHSERCYFASWWLQLCTPKDVTLHFDVCNFASWWLQLCSLMFVTLQWNGCYFAWLPLQNFLEAKSPIDFFLILNELHSAAENFTFLMRIHFILYQNTLHSRKEWSVFSYWA